MAFKMKGTPMYRNYGIGSPNKKSALKDGDHGPNKDHNHALHPKDNPNLDPKGQWDEYESQEEADLRNHDGTEPTVKGGTKTWSEGQKASGGELDKLVAKRKGLEKGSEEYKAIQRKINAALGSK